jgi:hypothetical protein
MVEGLGRQASRRSVYLESKRALPLGMLEAFDLPVMAPNCDARRCSTVATQALLFLNDQAVVAPARRMAERLRREQPGDPALQVRRAFLLAYGVEPTAAEHATCLASLNSLAEHFRHRGVEASDGKAGPGTAAGKGGRTAIPAEGQANTDAGEEALASLCQALLGTNRFLYVD